ncbi:MAG TPA: SDR family oxidoreductase [Candidatus Saccharimonadales bacterium]|nr:SDR family oxidoreductase [Candidatus Saccharimonadales bacterium]
MSGLWVVTGGAGFIGSHIVERLLREGRTVRAVDDFSSGTRANLEAARNGSGGSGSLEVLEGSLAEAGFAKEAIRGAEYVLHQAAVPSVPRSVKEPLRTHAANATGTLNVLEAAREQGVRRLVYASSSSAYGNTPTLPKVETVPTSPLSPYAIQKLAGEQYARVFHALYGLPTVCLRYFNVFGPRQDPASEYAAVIPKFITAMARGERPTVYGDGEQTRDFCFIDNTVEANLLSCTAGERALGRTFNIACGRRVSLLDLVRTLNGILGTAIEPELGAARAGDVKHSLADIGAARELLGYEVKVHLEEGLRRTAAWFTGGS